MLEKMTTENYKFFQHKACEFFPCHQTNDPDNFNCLFCYCPLYALGDKCGGNFKYLENGFKDCSGCMFPHVRANYEKIIARYSDIIELAKKR
jgi:Zn-finger protein